MDIPDIIKIIIFEDFLKIAKKKKRPPKDPIGALLGFLFRVAFAKHQDVVHFLLVKPVYL